MREALKSYLVNDIPTEVRKVVIAFVKGGIRTGFILAILGWIFTIVPLLQGATMTPEAVSKVTIDNAVLIQSYTSLADGFLTLCVVFAEWVLIFDMLLCVITNMFDFSKLNGNCGIFGTYTKANIQARKSVVSLIQSFVTSDRVWWFIFLLLLSNFRISTVISTIIAAL